MIEPSYLQKILNQLTFWRIVIVFILLSILRIMQKYWKIHRFLHEVTRKYGGKTYFRFPGGFPTRLEANQDDSLAWEKQSILENPKWRIYASHFGTNKTMVFIDPVLIKDFLSDQTRYRKSKVFKVFQEFLGKGLVFSDDKVWKKHRKLISETFRFEFIASQIPAISRITKELFEKELAQANGKHVNMLDLYQRITGELVFHVFFGSDLVDANIKGITPTKYLSRFINLIFENVYSTENILFGVRGIKLKLFKRNRELFQAENHFNQFITGIIEERKKKMNSNHGTDRSSASSTNKDFLSILLEAQRLSQGSGDEFTDEEVLHEFITFFVAGMDTTGHLLTMTTYFFYNSPHIVQERVIKEAESLANSKDEITTDKLNKVETLTAFFKETLRHATPAPVLFLREALVDHYVGDVKVSKGTMINCSFISNNFNSENFKDPQRFNPNRWIQGHEDFEADASKNSFIFTPFSAGPRNCIGQHLAMIEAKIIFSIFITNFKFKIPEDYKMRMRLLFVYGPRDPLYADVENRDENAPKNSFKCI